MGKIREFVRLSRLQTAALLTISLLFGFLVNKRMNGPLLINDIWADIIVLVFIGLNMHVLGFVMNEYTDLPYDRKDPEHTNKPLVKGTISMKGASWIIILTMAVQPIVFILYFRSFEALFIFMLCMLFGTMYNIYSKRIPGWDITLALWAFLFMLAGARSAGGLTWPVYSICGMGGIQILFNNQIEGGLKDAPGDRRCKARTLAVTLGVEEGDVGLKISMAFRMVSILIKVLFIAPGAVVLFKHFRVLQSPDATELAALVMFSLLSLIMIILHLYFMFKPIPRKALLKIFAVHELLSVALIYTSVLPLLGFYLPLILWLIPMLWYMAVNRLVYGNFLVPDV